MPSDNTLAALAAVVCLWLTISLFYWLIRSIVRREIKRTISKLRQAKFALVARDRKTGRFIK